LIGPWTIHVEFMCLMEKQMGSPYCLIDTILQRNCIVAINPYLVGTRKFHREEIMLPTPSPPEVS
jgi:hypothetical protein